MLTPMNHREMEYYVKKFWEEKNISEQNIEDIFSEWAKQDEKCAALRLLRWLEETQEAVFQKDLLLDYGADCLRLYLMFEKTPEPDDTWLDTWEECNLEGCYKFLSRFRRMILVANYANGIGKYQNLDACEIKKEVFRMQKGIMQHINSGNTMPERHNAISVIMEGMKQFQKKLNIGELVTSMHSHEITMAVPHAQKQEATEMDVQESNRNVELDDALAEMVLLVAPFAPIIAEHLWQRLKEDHTSVLQKKWCIQESKRDIIKLPIQVNAKTKKVMEVHAEASLEEIEGLAKEEISQILQGKEYKLIYVPNKIINFVIK